MNIGDSWPDSKAARERVLGIQTKLHQWATDDPKRRFDDLFNLVYDPASWLLPPGSGCGAIGGQGRPELTELHLAQSAPEQRNYWLGYEMISRPGALNRCRCGNG